MVPLSHLDDKEQPPAPESLEVRHSFGSLHLSCSFQAAVGGAGFAEVLHDWCLIHACDYEGKVGEVRLLCCVGWAGLEGALERF